jgi:hypothetical protein
LLGEKDEYRPSTERKVRRRVQQRLAASAADYGLLTGDSIAPAFEIDFERVGSTLPDSDLRRALVGQVAFAYKTAAATGFDGDRVVKEGVEQGKQDELAALIEQLDESPETLTIKQLGKLSEAGELDERSFRDMAESAAPKAENHRYADGISEERAEVIADVFVNFAASITPKDEK